VTFRMDQPAERSRRVMLTQKRTASSDTLRRRLPGEDVQRLRVRSRKSRQTVLLAASSAFIARQLRDGFSLHVRNYATLHGRTRWHASRRGDVQLRRRGRTICHGSGSIGPKSQAINAQCEDESCRRRCEPSMLGCRPAPETSRRSRSTGQPAQRADARPAVETTANFAEIVLKSDARERL